MKEINAFSKFEISLQSSQWSPIQAETIHTLTDYLLTAYFYTAFSEIAFRIWFINKIVIIIKR
jgi:hypothetical protein